MEYLSGSPPPESLSYEQVSYLYYGIVVMNATNVQDRVLQKIGREWFDGDPVDREAGLSTFLLPVVHAAIHEWGQMFQAHHHQAPSRRQFVGVALVVAIKELREQHNIPMTIRYTANEWVIQLDPCPLCYQHPVPCMIFLGVIERLLVLLHRMVESNPILQINTEASTGHRIVLERVG